MSSTSPSPFDENGHLNLQSNFKELVSTAALVLSSSGFGPPKQCFDEASGIVVEHALSHYKKLLLKRDPLRSEEKFFGMVKQDLRWFTKKWMIRELRRRGDEHDGNMDAFTHVGALNGPSELMRKEMTQRVHQLLPWLPDSHFKRLQEKFLDPSEGPHQPATDAERQAQSRALDAFRILVFAQRTVDQPDGALKLDRLAALLMPEADLKLVRLFIQACHQPAEDSPAGTLTQAQKRRLLAALTQCVPVFTPQGGRAIGLLPEGEAAVLQMMRDSRKSLTEMAHSLGCTGLQIAGRVQAAMVDFHGLFRALDQSTSPSGYRALKAKAAKLSDEVTYDCFMMIVLGGASVAAAAADLGIAEMQVRHRLMAALRELFGPAK